MKREHSIEHKKVKNKDDEHGTGASTGHDVHVLLHHPRQRALHGFVKYPAPASHITFSRWPLYQVHLMISSSTMPSILPFQKTCSVIGGFVGNVSIQLLLMGCFGELYYIERCLSFQVAYRGRTTTQSLTLTSKLHLSFKFHLFDRNYTLVDIIKVNSMAEWLYWAILD